MRSSGPSVFNLTPLLHGYAAFRTVALNLSDAASAQTVLLRRLLRQAAATRFGKDHEFSTISDITTYQARVPLRTYDDFHRHYWQREFPRLVDCTWPGLIPYFALSSGTTTGKSKYIPCSRDALIANRRGLCDVLVHHLANRPESQVLAGKSLVLGGSTALTEEAPGVFSGDLSGIEASEVGWWEAPWVLPPKELALTADWEAKIDRLAHLAITEDIRAISGAPNWLLLFFDKLLSLTPNQHTLVACFPQLELIIHGGIGFGPYRERFRQLMAGGRAETREVYFASEGLMAIADRDDGEGLRLVLDGGVFFEFVPVTEINSTRPTRLWIENVEIGVEYAVVVSTCAGLWSYVLGDTVRFVDLRPPRVLITGRTSYVLSTVGEHLIAEEIEEAIRFTSEACGVSVTDYAVGSLPQNGAGGTAQHLFVVEITTAPPRAGLPIEMGRNIDKRLMRLNRDYSEHRAHDYGLKPPQVWIVRPGAFAQWMKKRGKLGGQHKVPRIISDAQLFADLKSHASSPTWRSG